MTDMVAAQLALSVGNGVTDRETRFKFRNGVKPCETAK
jgi:hypothetical protein